MADIDKIAGYKYDDGALNHSHGFILPKINDILGQLPEQNGQKRIFDLGCGNGSVSAWLTDKGWDVTGIDASHEGIAEARSNHPDLKLEQASIYDDLQSKYGQFPVIISLEVVEHLYDPRSFAKQINNLLIPGGTAIVSTPYHGYWKNLVMALTGKMDAHFTALWDHGHIKFFSMETLTILMEEAGLKIEKFHRVGRVPILGKSMIAIVKKPL